MSSDRDQEYFSDGITEDLITDLSRWETIAVDSRSSTLRFQGQRVDIPAAGGELFLVEGSVPPLGECVRITAQLIDAQTGNQVWADRYDRPIADLPALQDELVRTIAETLVGRMFVSAAGRLRRRRPCNPAPYDLTMQADWLAWDKLPARTEAKRIFEQAIELDREYGLPHSRLALLSNDNDSTGSRDVPKSMIAHSRGQSAERSSQTVKARATWHWAFFSWNDGVSVRR
jgi:adenylate cyclase